MKRTMFAAAGLASLAACGGAPPAVQATPAASDTTETPPPAEVSSLTGVAFGSAFVRATADGAPSTSDKSSRADQALNTVASAEGDERKRSCGNQGVASHAQATAEFQPLSIPGVSQFGFSVSTTTYAKGGAWRERMVICRGAHATTAAADAHASGRIDLAFNSNAEIGEQLLLRVSGIPLEEAHLEIRDGQNQLLPLSAVPGGTWMMATLPKPGMYSLRATVESHAEHHTAGGTPAQHQARFSISVQSMRDALTLGFGQGPPNGVVLPLPVFLSADAVRLALDTAVFTDQHRLFACAVIACDTDRLRDVYVESPRVSMAAGAVVLDMHLGGSYQIARVFGGGVSGTIRATAVPVIDHDTLRFESPRIDVASSNTMVKWQAGSFEEKFLDRIRTVRIDLAPRLRAAVARAQEQIAAGWGGACLLLTPSEAHVRSVEVVTSAPQGIVADFDIQLSESAGGPCVKREAAR